MAARSLLTRTLIIASGASARWLGLPSEQALIGHGVSSCATCDGFFFSGKEITVIGGGDSAMEEALFLTRFATKVTIIHRRSEFRASKIMLDRARKHEQIQFMTDTVVEEVHDLDGQRSDRAAPAQCEDRQGHSTSRPAPCSWESDIRRMRTSSAISSSAMAKATSFPKAMFAAACREFSCRGDVADRHYRQAVTAAGTGCMAALEVEKYLEEIGK